MIRKIILRLSITFGLCVIAFFVIPKFATADVINGITRPINGATLTGVVAIRANFYEPRYLAWQLDLIPINNPQATIFVGRGTNHSDVTGQLTRLDSSLYPNGDYQLRLRVIKNDGNYTEYFSQVTIDNEPQTENGIVGVQNGVKLGCLQTILGVAHSDYFLKYQLDLLLYGDEHQAILLQRGSQQHWLTSELAQFDTTQFPNGNHMLRLRVVHNDGNYETYYAPITIDNSIMKDALNSQRCTCAVPDPNATSSSEPNGITNPPDATTLAGTIPICGNAFDPNLLAWQVDLLFYGNAKQAVVLAYGETSNLLRNPFTLLDTTALPDGRYGLRLTVARTDNTFTQKTIYMCIQNHSSSANCGK